MTPGLALRSITMLAARAARLWEEGIDVDSLDSVVFVRDKP